MIVHVSSVTVVSSFQNLDKKAELSKKMKRDELLKNEQEQLRLKHEEELLENEQNLNLLKQERLKKEKELEAVQFERQKLEQEEQLERMKMERQKEEEQRENIKLERQQKILQERQEEQKKQAKERLEEERLEEERLLQERLVQERLVQERLVQERLVQEHLVQERLAEERKFEERKFEERLVQERLVEKIPAEERLTEEESTTMPSTPSITGDFSSSSSSTNLFERTFPAMSHETSFHPYNLPLITSRNHDRDYYDDDLSSDLDSEHIIDLLPTPPSTPSKFSPKRILHRAKSSINDDSVRNLGRRTSLFLEKRLNPSTTSDEFSINSLRRQSSKISSKGKSLSKKLKRVLSFSQS